MDPAFTVGALVRDARLLDPAGDRVGDQLFVPLASRPSVIDLRYRLTGLVIAVGIDPGERTDAAGCRPSAGALAIRHRNPLAAFDEREHLASRDYQRIERFHWTAPCGGGSAGLGSAAADTAARSPTPAAARIWGTSENTEVTPHSSNMYARAGSLT